MKKRRNYTLHQIRKIKDELFSLEAEMEKIENEIMDLENSVTVQDLINECSCIIDAVRVTRTHPSNKFSQYMRNLYSDGYLDIFNLVTPEEIIEFINDHYSNGKKVNNYESLYKWLMKNM